MKAVHQFIFGLTLLMGMTAPVDAASPTGTVRTVGGSFTPGYVDGDNNVSLFNAPWGLYLDVERVLIADFGNNAIRTLDANEVAGTFSQNGAAGPVDITVEADGDVLVANRTGGTVVRYNRAGVLQGVLISGLASPTAIAVDGAGDIHVALSSGQVRKYDAAGTLLRTDTVTAGFVQLRGIVPMPDGVIVSDAGNHVLWKFPLEGGAAAIYAGTLRVAGFAEGSPGLGRFNAPHGLGVTTNGIVVVADRLNHRVRAVTSAGVISTLYGVDPATWQGLPEEALPGWTDGPAADAELREPVGLAVSLNGDVFNTEVHYSLIRRVTGLTFPTNAVVLLAITNTFTPNSGVFPSGVTVTVQNAGDPAGGFPPDAKVYYTTDGSTPGPENLASKLAQFTINAAEIQLPGPVDLKDLRVRVFNGNTAGPVTQGQAVDVGRPNFSPKFGFFPNGVTLWVTNSASSSGLFSTNTALYYTTNATEPNLGSFKGTIQDNGVGQIVIADAVDLGDVRVRAFVGATGGESVGGLTEPPVPNRISLGFESGEASSEFYGAAGQTFYAPITLTVVPTQRIYGMQFNVMVTNINTAPDGPYFPSFESMLMELLPEGFFRRIDPKAAIGFDSQIITQTNVAGGVTNIVVTTNVFPVFTPLVIGNGLPPATANFLGIGWLERSLFTNLYNTKAQHLIQYSLPHDNLFPSSGGKVVVGAFIFNIPPGATNENDHKYTVKIGRPSANGDGIGSDVVIDAPQGDPTSSIPLTATRTLNIQSRAYLVGDVAPFRWFNAGDFGDTNILNNDLEQLHQSMAYGINSPPESSDMWDALDSCCVVQLLDGSPGADITPSFQVASRAQIDSVAFGDGDLTLEDLYVTFRRSLDPGLVNYKRYWSNGVLRAVQTSNSFRGIVGMSLDSDRVTQLDATRAHETPGANFSLGSLRVEKGVLARVPVTVDITGQFPVSSMLLRVRVNTLDGATRMTSPISFTPKSGGSISGPTWRGSQNPNEYSVSWLDMPVGIPGGRTLIGTIDIPIPFTATPDAVFQVMFERAEASTGLSRFPVTTTNALVLMSNRAFAPWTDEIPDAWRIQHFGSLMNILSAPEADADGDGVNNLHEFRAGTNPTEILSRFAMRGQAVESEASLILSWPTVSGRSYRLESSDTLRDGEWTLVEDNIAGNGGQIQRLRPREAKARFYRVNILP